MGLVFSMFVRVSVRRESQLIEEFAQDTMIARIWETIAKITGLFESPARNTKTLDAELALVYDAANELTNDFCAVFERANRLAAFLGTMVVELPRSVNDIDELIEQLYAPGNVLHGFVKVGMYPLTTFMHGHDEAKRSDPKSGHKRTCKFVRKLLVPPISTALAWASSSDFVPTVNKKRVDCAETRVDLQKFVPSLVGYILDGWPFERFAVTSNSTNPTNSTTTLMDPSFETQLRANVECDFDCRKCSLVYWDKVVWWTTFIGWFLFYDFFLTFILISSPCVEGGYIQNLITTVETSKEDCIEVSKTTQRRDNASDHTCKKVVQDLRQQIDDKLSEVVTEAIVAQTPGPAAQYHQQMDDLAERVAVTNDSEELDEVQTIVDDLSEVCETHDAWLRRERQVLLQISADLTGSWLCKNDRESSLMNHHNNRLRQLDKIIKRKQTASLKMTIAMQQSAIDELSGLEKYINKQQTAIDEHHSTIDELKNQLQSLQDTIKKEKN